MAQLVELVDRTLSGVGVSAPEICSISDAHNAVIQALNVRIAFARLSKSNSATSTTAQFFPNATEYDITAMIGGGTPIGCEVFENPHYVSVRAFALDYLPENNLDIVGFGCAFERRTNEVTGETRVFIRFNVIPQQAVRIIYASGVVAKSLEQDAIIPDTVNELIVLEAQNIIIPRICQKYIANMNRNEQDRKDASMMVSMFNNIQASNMMRIPALEQLWRIWAFKPTQKNAGRLATPRASRLYE